MPLGIRFHNGPFPQQWLRFVGYPAVGHVDVVLVERMAGLAGRVDDPGTGEVLEVDDHPHRRHRHDFVSLRGVPAVGVDQIAAAG